MEIRYIMPGDDRMQISKIYEESWKYAYHGIIPQAYLESIPKGQWVTKLDDSDKKTLICTDNGNIVGTSSFCSSRFRQFAHWGEIISIYLLPGYMGKGYGKKLLESAISELRELGYKDVFLWVLEENTRARYFYEKFGFIQTENVLDDILGGKKLREIRYIYTQKENEKQ